MHRKNSAAIVTENVVADASVAGSDFIVGLAVVVFLVVAAVVVVVVGVTTSNSLFSNDSTSSDGKSSSVAFSIVD